jgi:hypothetical protein
MQRFDGSFQRGMIPLGLIGVSAREVPYRCVKRIIERA